MPEGPIKSAGDHLIRVSPHSEVVVEFTIKVVPEMSDNNFKWSFVLENKATPTSLKLPLTHRKQNQQLLVLCY